MLRINSKRGALELSRVSRFVCAMFALGAIAPVLMAQTTPVAAYKVDPSSSAAAGSSIEAGGVVVGQNYTFALCEASGREMLCGLSPAPAGSQDGDTALTAVGFAKQEERRRLYNEMKKKGKVKKTAAVAMPALACKWFLDTDN